MNKLIKLVNSFRMPEVVLRYKKVSNGGIHNVKI